MRKLKQLIMVSAIMLIAVAGYSQSEEELRDRIEKMNNKMAEQMVSGDYMASLDFYTNDAISLPNWSPMIRGMDEMKRDNEQMMQREMKINDFNFETVEIMQCGDMVIEIGKYKMSMDMPQMPETMHDQGKYMTVWEKQADGSLKIKADIWNTSQNPMSFMGNMPHDKEMMDKKDYHEEKYREKDWKEKPHEEKKWEKKEGK